MRKAQKTLLGVGIAVIVFVFFPDLIILLLWLLNLALLIFSSLIESAA